MYFKSVTFESVEVKQQYLRIENGELPKHGLSEILKGNDEYFPLGRYTIG